MPEMRPLEASPFDTPSLRCKVKTVGMGIGTPMSGNVKCKNDPEVSFVHCDLYLGMDNDNHPARATR